MGDMSDLDWTDADQERFVKGVKGELAELLRSPASLWDMPSKRTRELPSSRSRRTWRTYELLNCVDALRDELIAWAEGR